MADILSRRWVKDPGIETTQNENRTYNALDVLYILSYKQFANVTNGLLYASHA